MFSKVRSNTAKTFVPKLKGPLVSSTAIGSMKTLDLKLSHKVLILVTVPIIFMLVFVSILGFLQKRAEDEIWRERHSKAVIAECNGLMRNIMDSGMFIFLYEETHQHTFLQRYRSLSEQIPVQLSSLKMMLRDSPHRESALQQLDKAGGAVISLLRSADQMIEREAEGGHASAASQTQFIAVSRDMLATLKKFISEQQEVERTNPQNETFFRLMITACLLTGIVISIALAIVLAVFFNKATTRRLLLLVDNANRLAAGKGLNPTLAGSDEIAHLDRVFHDMAEALADAARRKQELVQMVTHDLRTPLTAINSSLHLMIAGLAGQMDETARNRATMSKRSAERLLNLINDLLDIERLETGNFPIDKRSVPAEELLQNAAESVKAFAAERQVTIQIQDTDLTVFADPQRMEQVVINLISNAVKFSPAGAAVELEVSEAADSMEFLVIDHGRGVPPEYHTVIFERFGQVKKEDSKRGKGTGLGLPICKALVEAHQGTIGVRSKEGEGSTFWFRIPRTKQ